MIKSVLTCCRVVACLLLPAFFNSAFALDTFDHNLSFTHTLELKPIPSYQIAKSTFLPDRYDDLGLSSYDSLDSNYNDKSCESYPLTSCPAGAKCEKCPFNIKLYRAYACSEPYVMSAGTCTCPPAVSTSNPNDVCIKYCGSTCIEKTCTPSIDQTNCTNDKVACDDGCGGTSRLCCIPCTNKITSKPANAEYIYENCTDGDGTHQIQVGWKCIDGFHENGGTCEKDCIVNSCSGYDLTECPSDKVCDSCTPTAANCSTEAVKYMVIGCKDNKKDTDTFWCSIPQTIDCATLGYKRALGSCGSLTQIACPFDSSKVACIDFE